MSKVPHFDALHDGLAARFPGTPVGKLGNQAKKFHLHHAPNSICSQKVRTVLALTAQAYESHPLNIFEGVSYDPAYVRLRARIGRWSTRCANWTRLAAATGSDLFGDAVTMADLFWGVELIRLEDLGWSVL